MNTYIPLEELEKEDQVIRAGRDYIPDQEMRLRRTIFQLFLHSTDLREGAPDAGELLAEAVCWSIGELVNNANKANNRWALLRNALYQRVKTESPDTHDDQIYREIEYAIEHNQTDLLKKYNLLNLDLTESILRLIQMHQTNSFALSERFNKKIDITLRIRERGGMKHLVVNVVNNSPITVVDKKRVEFNLDKVKEDLLNAGRSPFEAAMQLYDRLEDRRGGGFGAGLRSIILFLKEAYDPYGVQMTYSRLIQYRSTSSSTIFSVELPIPT